jgi:hypothetical protein
MLLVDTVDKVFMRDEVLKKQLACKYPCHDWLKEVSV